jgi:hypothetical protein
MDYKPKHSMIVHGQKCHVSYCYYDNGRMAIKYICDEGVMGVLTVNIPDTYLADGEFFVKTWSENEKLAKAAINTGIFEDTGKREPTGFVEAQVWKFKKQE